MIVVRNIFVAKPGMANNFAAQFEATAAAVSLIRNAGSSHS
jgi:hypothetical protein